MEENPTLFSVLDSLNGDWLKLVCEAMREVGPASQTLGALLTVTSRVTFLPAEQIAERAYLPLSTVRKHLRSLDAAGWISSQGRQKTRSGWLRRTATIRVTAKTLHSLTPENNTRLTYGVLPQWVCDHVARYGRLPWSARAVLSLVMAKLMGLKWAIEQQIGVIDTDDEFAEQVEDVFGGAERFAFSLAQIRRDTGLDCKSIVAAKRILKAAGLIDWREGPVAGGRYRRDLLVPCFGGEDVWLY